MERMATDSDGSFKVSIVPASNGMGFRKERTRVYMCACGAEALSVEFENDPEWDFIYCSLSLWQYGHSLPVSIWSRIRLAMRILWRGHVHADSICLSRSQFEDFRRFINDAPKNP